MAQPEMTVTILWLLIPVICIIGFIIAKFTRPVFRGKLPKAGESWQLPPDETPWGEKTYAPVTIVDVRDGWVRYDMAGSVFTDQRMKLSRFLAVYRLCAND